MSVANMAASTPRRSSRLPHTHTPKMSERKKGLFQAELETSRESLTKHRRLPVVDSESDSEDCDLGIISTLDSSSGEENDPSVPKTPERSVWRETRSQARKLLKENNDLKNFIKSPFTLKKYQTRCVDSKCSGSLSTPATPHLQNHPGTPSSTHSCTSVHTTSSTSSRARKSLASLIADTESCSSSLKDLNFDTDSGSDSKENTPTKSIRRSNRKQKLTPKFQSFKGVLMEQKKNMTPMKSAVVCLTKMDMSTMMSPTQMMKTPNSTTEVVGSPPKIHNRRSVVEIAESPESACESEKSHKRLRNDSMSEGPTCKLPRLDVPKARLSLFNSDRLKEILSAKSFYGKSNPELNTTVAAKISHAIEASATHPRRPLTHTHSNKQKRKPGQINLGVKHRIRKPKHHKKKVSKHVNGSFNSSVTLNKSSVSMNDASMLSQNSSQELNEKADPFQREKQTIDALLSQWTEEEVPESELIYTRREEIPCFNSTVIEETNQIFQPVTAVPVTADLPQDEAVIVELGAQKQMTSISHSVTNISQSVTDISQSVSNTLTNTHSVTLTSNETTASNVTVQDVVMVEPEGHAAAHGEVPSAGQFQPVEGGYILVDENVVEGQEELPDLDEIERELKMLDEQILNMAKSNNIDAEAVLKSTETVFPADSNEVTQAVEEPSKTDKPQKLFPIFSKPNSGASTPTSKGTSEKSNKKIIKTGNDQYVIDAGQKKFGATQCAECGTIYQIGDPQDEHDHLVHHDATDVLRFNGWKEECVVGRFGTARCLRVRGGEPGWRKVDSILDRVVHPYLGYEGKLRGDHLHAYTAFLYVDKKQIVGCLIVEPKTRAYKLVSSDPDCCSVESYPVKCGVSRLWCHANHRRRGVATHLLDCARASFLYGTALVPQDLAFSAPTPAGKAFATKYCGTENFYVYLD
ncbi:N-acetyltransferase ESCO1 [Manduca sexta]|uniref:N-acetyltransferase ESCO1 n=1 Tax=Manduca sexta TaxID=7130 RepID=UPI00188E098A|nr:N-acetyltransferase ESCO1 [Manduca sexta]